MSKRNGRGGDTPEGSRGSLRMLMLTSDLFPPFRPAARAIFGDEFARRGHVVDWLLRPDPGSGRSGEQPFGNGTAYVAETDPGGSRWRRFRKHWLNFVNDLRVFGLLRRRRYDLVQVKDKYIGALLAIVAARLTGVPLFYWIAFPHSESSLYAARHGVARYRFLYLVRGTLQKWSLYKLILPSARHVFVQSEQMRRDMEAEGVPREKMTPVPSSLNIQAVVERAGDLPSSKPDDEQWIVYLGTLLRQRGLDFLVRVLARVADCHPGARLLFVGRGEMPQDEKLLIDEARRLNVEDRVRITGWLETDQAWSYVRASDVCLSPYLPIPILRSTSPTKLIEYMAMAKPVVANTHPEQTDVIQRSGAGLLCDWDEQSFAEAVSYLLEHPEEAAEMGRRGRSYVESCRSHEKMADLVEATYRRLLAASAGIQEAAAQSADRP